VNLEVPTEELRAGPDVGKALSLRGYGRRRGTSVESVRRAIKRERLKACLCRDARGNVKIADPDLADREWARNTDLSKAPGYVKQRSVDGSVTGPVTASVTAVGDAGEPSLAESSRSEKQWKARSAELDYRKKAGELIELATVQARDAQLEALWGEIVVTFRTKMLGLPSKLRQRCAKDDVTDPALRVLNVLIEEALEELAGEQEQPRRLQ
jgi:hypothetical protein